MHFIYEIIQARDFPESVSEKSKEVHDEKENIDNKSTSMIEVFNIQPPC